MLAVPACVRDGSQTTLLKVVFGPDDGSRGLVVFRLRCDPPSGTIQDPRAACRAIATRPRLVTTPPSNVTCSPPIGMWQVTITGTFRGKAVRQEFGSCENQVFAWMRLAHYAPCPANFAYFVKPCTHGPYAFGKAHIRGLYPTVPKVVGMTASAAEHVLHDGGLQTVFTPSYRPNRLVVAQTPRPGTSATVYAVVKLTIRVHRAR